MWPFKEKPTKHAIAYLKAVVPDNDLTPAIQMSQDDSVISQPFAPGLAVCYVVDTGNSYQYIQYRNFREDGTLPEDLHKRSILNLRLLADRRTIKVQPYQNIFAVLMGGDFEASLLLLNDLWEGSFRQFVKGPYAVAVPARDILAFCDNQSVSGIEELNQLIGRIYPNGDHLISNQLYIRDQGQCLLRTSA